jgi:ribose transport system substrate-binding protein
MKIRTFLALVGIVALALTLGGCRGSGKPKVAFVSNNAYDFWTFAQKGAEKAAEEEDVELEFKKPHESKVDVQQEIIDSLINRGFKGIAVSPNEPKNAVAYYKNKVHPKVALVMADNDLPDSAARRCYIGTHNYRAGRGAGELVKKAFPKGAKLAIFVGSNEATNAIERRQGLLDVLSGIDPNQKEMDKKTPIDAVNLDLGNGYTLMITNNDEGKVKKCQDDAQDFLIQNPTVDCLVGLWEYNPPALLRAVRNSKNKSKPLIVAFDENVDTLKGIRTGEVVGTIVQDPYQFGYQSIKVLAQLARGKDDVLKTWPEITANQSIFVPHKTVEKAGLDDFEKYVKDILGK